MSLGLAQHTARTPGPLFHTVHCVILGRLLTLSVPWFPHLESRSSNSPTPQSCVTLNVLAFTKGVGEDLAHGERPIGVMASTPLETVHHVSIQAIHTHRYVYTLICTHDACPPKQRHTCLLSSPQSCRSPSCGPGPQICPSIAGTMPCPPLPARFS